MVIWLIGLSGAGKTTIGTRLVERLRAAHDNIVFLDGDMLREVWGDDLGHDLEGRRKNARRVSHLCRLLDRQGVHVVTAILSVFPEWQRWNRQEFSSYFQVFLDVPMEVLKGRDSKGLYAAAARGDIANIVGLDIDFPTPIDSDLVLSGQETTQDPEKLVQRILAAMPSMDLR